MIEVIDDSTFMLEVTGYDQFNNGLYEGQVKIEVDWLSSDDTLRGMTSRSKIALQEKLLGKAVKCITAGKGRSTEFRCSVRLM